MGYQKIEIGGVLYESGIDRESEYRAIFPEPPTDKTILDIGCHMGFYLMRADREGALHCVGCEVNKEWAQRGQEIAQAAGCRVTTIINMSIFRLQPGPYDVVLCLNFLHHLPTMQSLELLYKIDGWTRERMVFVLLDPSDKDATLSIEPTPERAMKLRVSYKYLRALWPDYKITTQPSTVPPAGRTIVDVRKPC
jgi:cyclopropane fatty-acyl-phospholipid synthase-like methyltransferase